ncbi:hypothetical protein EV426DRAFT_417183 [Tirmania nivea]|nr:hypothetical protein EV426DRAFT_417183 [Tirmania nivea]
MYTTVDLGLVTSVLARPGTSQQRPNATVGSSGGQSTGETPRSQAQARRALDRDSSTCVLSGENSPYNEVAYIFPYSVGRFFSSSPESGPTNLHTFLSLFAGSTIISMLESYLLSPVRSRSGAYWTRINRLENLFTLTPTLHRMWDDCVFTLIPIGDPLAGISDCSEFTSYSVTFQWLPKHRHPQLDLTQVSNPGQHMGEEEDSTVSGPFVFNHRTNTRLVSGTVIRLHTSDPISHPLPHPDLLRLHAAIARVVRCAGASGEKQGDDYCGEDEEEWEEPALKIDSFGEEEVEQPEDLELVETQLPTPWVLRHHTSNAKPISFALRRFMQGD